MKKQYLTIPELAKILGISRIAVFKKVKKGTIRATKMGKTYMIPAKDIIGILGDTLTEKDKERVDEVIKKTIAEYGETLKKLAKEDE